ncbi:MAG: hypothetical protein KAI83_13985 [Thiomargarita sp.]|nr:hypothetical protein [Thiomargarita sp.]
MHTTFLMRKVLHEKDCATAYILIHGRSASCNAERCGSHSQMEFGNEETRKRGKQPNLGTGNPLTANEIEQLH